MVADFTKRIFGCTRESRKYVVVLAHFCVCLISSLTLVVALLDRVRSVQGDVDKLLSENETLQMYIDNLTMQMAKRR